MTLDTMIHVLNTESNPYEEGSPYWNCLIDLNQTVDKYGLVLLKDLIDQHGTNLEYYSLYLPVLEQDGNIIINNPQVLIK